uniref:Synaptobrevin, longin-like domain protein n=1 Tax=Tanacetum cinerariifolium TaxID=118510 RepID=A0A699IR52_TANCI|nr:hypothetical protein [Tanacetum cinerariifolium]
MVILEAAIKDVLRLNDAEGVDCLPNEEIFAKLARMGYEKPSTKLTFYKAFFSSQWKFLIHTLLQSMSAKHSTSKFYMYPRFIQLMLRNQLGDLSTHTTKYTSPVLTQKVFANMMRVEKGFSGVETPLFEGIVVVGVIVSEGNVEEQVQHTLPHSRQPQPLPQAQAQQQAADFPMSLLQEALDACAPLARRVEHLECDKAAQALEISNLKRRVKKLEKGNRVKVLKLQRLKKVGTSQRIDTSDDTMIEDASNQGMMIDDLDRDEDVALMDDKEEEKKAEEAKVSGDNQVQGRQAEIYQIDMDHASKVLSMQEDEPAEVHKVVDVVTTAKLITEVVTAASESVTAASITIFADELQVPAATITAVPVRVAAASTRKRKGVVIRDPKEESTRIIPADTKSKDKGKEIMLEEPKPLKKKQSVKMDEEFARKLHEELNKDIDWDMAIEHVKLDYFNGISYDDIRPIFKVKFNSNMDFLLKTRERMEEEERIAIQSINETLAQKAAKRRKLNEEVKDLNIHLEIVPDEDDDVYTEATPLARKVPVMDYEIIQINNKPHYKIIRADGTHQLYVSILTLLKNFDREDLESLWSLVKERFSISKPDNFSDDFLLTTLGAMFEKPDGQA